MENITAEQKERIEKTLDRAIEQGKSKINRRRL